MKLSHLVGEVLDEKYRIEKQLGRGGMGAVFLATHLGTERPVALKVITPEFMKHQEFVERFRREARAAGRLRHPNVVDVTDFGFARVGADDRVAYLVMEYLDGCTLAEVLAEEKSIPVGWVVDIIEQACSAVNEAHEQGIVHRDIKPDNIWLEPNRRGSYTVKVLDFGIARLADPAQTDANAELALLAQTAPTLQNSSAAENVSISLEAPTMTPGFMTRPERAADATSKVKRTQDGSEDVNATRKEPESAESATLLRTPAPATDVGEESSTLMLPPKQSALEEGTRILEHKGTTSEQRQGQTASIERLTQVGSILGTPLYMSPEQCRGETTDARSDIYSLGVIGYQMLAGQTPFNGDMAAVIDQHLRRPPPPLDTKRIPKKVAGVIMSALAKNPLDRPPTAAALSSALRAHSEGIGSLLRRALTLYGEHLPVFLRLILIVYSPYVLITVLEVILRNLIAAGVVPRLPGELLGALLSIISLFVAFFVGGVIIGMTTRLVTQLLVAPLRPLKLRPAFAALRKRLKPLAITSLTISFMTMLGLMLCIVPAFYIMITYYLVTPVVMMEEIKGRAAFRRAKELSKRSRRTVVAVILLQVFIPLLVGALISFLAITMVKAYNPGGRLQLNAFNNLFQIAQIPLTVIMASFSSVVTALLYWKTRLAGGETLREAFMEFEREEMPDRNWQRRIRERLHMPTRVNRSEVSRSRLDR